MRRALLALAVVALYALHQDVWLWRTPRPLLLGFLPPGLVYHVAFSVAAALLMWLLVAWAWPRRLEEEVERGEGREERVP